MLQNVAGESPWAEYLDFDNAALYASLARRSLEKYVAQGLLPASQMGKRGKRLIKRSDLDAFLKANPIGQVKLRGVR